MYSLLVCDDEQIMIESVRHIVEKEFSDIRIVETARSGREAIEKTLTTKPDIILTDIRMPGINGLDAVKEIKKVHSDVKIVIVSVYEFFEYAKQAVKLGVSEYLTKPVKKDRLVDTLKRVMTQLHDERLKYSWELEAKERIERMLSAVEHSFIYELLFNQMRACDIRTYKSELFDPHSETGFIFVMTFNKHGKGEDYADQLRAGFDMQEIYAYFKDCLKQRWRCIVGPIMTDRVVAYVDQGINDLYEQRVRSITLIEDIAHMLEERYRIEIRVGIGRIHEDQDIMLSYQEALRALNCTEGGRCVHIDDIAPHILDAGYDIAMQEQRLILSLENGDVQKSLTVLSDIFRKYPNLMEQENIHYRIIEMMAAVRRVATENGIHDNTEPGYYMKQILCCKSGEALERICTEAIRHIACEINARKKCCIGKIVERTNVLINERFSQNLSLDDISKELHVSPQYLSRLYKNETGENFIDRLTSVRIENAKRLMKEGRYTIKEICFMSGYCDPNYFSKLFKKHVGISPTNYQRQGRGGL